MEHMPLPSRPRRARARRGSGEELRAEILHAARELLAKAPNADSVSIRAIAQQVGVTAPSIYRHFADKDELIDAVVGDVFEELGARLQAGAEGIDDPLERLRQRGLAYISFARQFPEHYRLATMQQAATASTVDHVLTASAFVHFASDVSACIEEQIFTGNPVDITLEFWAAAHGLASLIVAKPFLPWTDLEGSIERVLASSCFGRSVYDMLGGEPTVADFRAWWQRRQDR